MNPEQIRAVLDTGALIAYSLGDMAVGETLTEMASEESARFAVPALCLLEAHRHATSAEQHNRLGVLRQHPLFWGAPLTTDQLDILRIWHPTAGADAHAAYVLLSSPHAMVLTDRAAMYVVDLGIDTGLVNDITEKWED